MTMSPPGLEIWGLSEMHHCRKDCFILLYLKKKLHNSLTRPKNVKLKPKNSPRTSLGLSEMHHCGSHCRKDCFFIDLKKKLHNCPNTPRNRHNFILTLRHHLLCPQTNLRLLNHVLVDIGTILRPEEWRNTFYSSSISDKPQNPNPGRGHCHLFYHVCLF